jgi:hypothetical protein
MPSFLDMSKLNQKVKKECLLYTSDPFYYRLLMERLCLRFPQKVELSFGWVD